MNLSTIKIGFKVQLWIVALLIVQNAAHAQRDIKQCWCNSLFASKTVGKWGYVDEKGELAIPAIFDSAGEFKYGRGLVEVNGLWGIVDTRGNWIKSPSMKTPLPHMSERRILVPENGQKRFLDENGDPIPGTFDDAGWFAEGLAPVKLQDKWGYIDPTGTMVIKPQFDAVGNFVEGLARVSRGDKEYFIDKGGIEVIKLPKGTEVTAFSEGLAVVRFAGESLYGYIDRTGAVSIRPKYEEAGDFFEGLAKVKVKFDWGFVNKKRNIAIDAIFRDAGDFHDGLAAVQIGEKWGYIDSRGRTVIDPIFDRAFDFGCNIAYVESKDRWGYITKNGTFLFSPKLLR